MIEFRGELSSKCKKYIVNKIKLVTFLGLIFTSIVLLVPAIILTIKNGIFIFLVILLVVFPFIVSIPSKKDKSNYKLPYVIKIKDKTISLEGKNTYHTESMNNVKKILDYGEWYHIIFNISLNPGNFICQKDLIKVGTIEEFEKLFEGKIIRKNKK